MTEIEQDVSEAMGADANYPLGDPDAMKWAVAWRLTRDRNGIDANASQAAGDIDGWMIGWFANCMASAHPKMLMTQLPDTTTTTTIEALQAQVAAKDAEIGRELPAWLTEKEIAAINALSKATDMSGKAVLRQALRLYQLHNTLLAAGEITGWSGDAARAAEFAGPLAEKPSLSERIKYMSLPQEPHTDVWQLGFCRARKMASEMAFLDELARAALGQGEG